MFFLIPILAPVVSAVAATVTVSATAAEIAAAGAATATIIKAVKDKDGSQKKDPETKISKD